MIEDFEAVSKTELAKLKQKAEKWDKLGEKIEAIYGTEDENGDWVETKGDEGLIEIGELAAIAYGWL